MRSLWGIEPSAMEARVNARRFETLSPVSTLSQFLG